MKTGLRVVLHLLQVLFLVAAALGAIWGLADVYLEVPAPEYDTSVVLMLLILAVVGVGFSPMLWSSRRHALPALSGQAAAQSTTKVSSGVEEPSVEQFSAFTPPSRAQQ
jgi:asparagine N-glycosylation enzyme membrane subunit Stt3